MDVLAHTLWTNALFHLKYHRQRKMRYLAAFFGVAPDLVGFAPLFIYLILSGRFFSDSFPFSSHTNWTFAFASEAYNYTHSLVIFSFAFLLVSIIGMVYRYSKAQRFTWWAFWPMLGWAVHILIDIPTHAGNFYLTPFLFPLSDARFAHGISWAHPKFMLINYALMILVYLGLYYYQRKSNAQN